MCFDCHSIWICLVSYKIHNGDDTPKEKIPEVVKNIREFYTTQIFVTVFTNKPLFFLILIQNNLLHVSHTVSLRWFPILFPNLCFQVQPIFHIVQPKCGIHFSSVPFVPHFRPSHSPNLLAITIPMNISYCVFISLVSYNWEDLKQLRLTTLNSAFSIGLSVFMFTI